ncbi:MULTISPECIES: hypothetical protein [unclassified Caulobacter]|jgi:hypothetical protein|uniref:hypothetical protein n=1 Tax=unclassified Caulobacter TaxID=2648921 RepID=UPI0006F48B0F|nr:MULTISPECIES: hypothetical protein [unclassified Caulobacter]KQV56973.1 hypothetical protein ASC62_11830 [Caulobacter sp. Root342]KQV66459.1 hypothetical protein ASC70_11470 [Caulobacter sp. Root343]
MTGRPAPSRRLFLAAACAVYGAWAASPALANAKKEKKEGGEQALDPSYKLGSMTIPIIYNGRIVNYVFVAMTLTLTSGTEVQAFKDKEPALRDAIIRAAYRTPFTRGDTWKEVDGPRLTGFVMGQCASLFGKGKVASVEIVKQIPRQQLMPPRSNTVKAGASSSLNP